MIFKLTFQTNLLSLMFSFLILGPLNPMHTSTPIIQTNNVSLNFTKEIVKNVPRLQQRRRRSLVNEEDAAIFWQETLATSQISQDTVD